MRQVYLNQTFNVVQLPPPTNTEAQQQAAFDPTLPLIPVIDIIPQNLANEPRNDNNGEGNGTQPECSIQ
jgi:hypothetical protein